MEDAAGRSIGDELPIDANEPRRGVAPGMGGERIKPILLEDRPAARLTNGSRFDAGVVVGVAVAGLTAFGVVAAPRRGPRSSSRPQPSMTAENPVLAAIARGVRTSTARKMPLARCMSSSLDPQNQPSLVRLTRMSGRAPNAAERLTTPRIAPGRAVS